MIYGHHVVVVMEEVKPQSKLHPVIAERLKERKCICGCGKAIYRNGLARSCHYEVERKLFSLPPSERPAYITRLVRRGLWLTASLGRWFKKAPTKFDVA